MTNSLKDSASINKFIAINKWPVDMICSIMCFLVIIVDQPLLNFNPASKSGRNQKILHENLSNFGPAKIILRRGVLQG